MNLWRIHETTTNSPNANLLIEGQTAPFPAEWLRDSPMCIYTYRHTCRYVGSIAPQANDHLVKTHTAVQNEGRRRCALLCRMETAAAVKVHVRFIRSQGFFEAAGLLAEMGKHSVSIH